ncbi:hypothetical protein BT96DRAFT_1017439 [Gymnopus androsaceus JB14]|uniref:F-box domain-containing protein n=1 Tax=Gymnopus androsaceus JB14 TaxID=1447944 RepID=A0A6A4HY57_9AGAR|nr:hypothetical protein BT96DRAFT_1017439 [Gymnopus androsaceus JB14]
MAAELAGSKCPTCGTSNFTPRLDLQSDFIRRRIFSDYDPAACTEIEETISLLDAEHQDCASEIVRLQLQIEALSSRQRQLKECESKFRCLLSPSPIQKLPNEVLMSVFDLVSQDNLLREERKRFSDLWPDGEHGLTAMPALVLSSICSGWRQITLSHSALWSRMTLVLAAVHIMEDIKASFFTMVKLYIDRSHTSLLRLRIDMAKYYSAGSVPHSALSLLGKTSQRWHHLTFIGSNLFRREIFSIPDNVRDFPSLRELAFKLCDRAALEVFGQAPNLRCLEVAHDAIELTSNFPWSQLTSVAVTSAERLDEVMDRCPNLASIRFQLVWYTPHFHPPRAFQSLKSLFIIFLERRLDSGWLNIVLSCCICPSLTSLTLEMPEDYSTSCTWPLRTLESFLIQSSCALNDLSVRGFQITDNDLIAVFRRIPSLTSLIVEDSRFNWDMDSSTTITPALIQSL